MNILYKTLTSLILIISISTQANSDINHTCDVLVKNNTEIKKSLDDLILEFVIIFNDDLQKEIKKSITQNITNMKYNIYNKNNIDYKKYAFLTKK
jgi:hypothetical protein